MKSFKSYLSKNVMLLNCNCLMYTQSSENNNITYTVARLDSNPPLYSISGL